MSHAFVLATMLLAALNLVTVSIAAVDVSFVNDLLATVPEGSTLFYVTMSHTLFIIAVSTIFIIAEVMDCRHTRGLMVLALTIDLGALIYMLVQSIIYYQVLFYGFAIASIVLSVILILLAFGALIAFFISALHQARGGQHHHHENGASVQLQPTHGNALTGGRGIQVRAGIRLV